MYIATLRENQQDLLRVQKAQELKNLAQSRGISLQRNMRKADVGGFAGLQKMYFDTNSYP